MAANSAYIEYLIDHQVDHKIRYSTALALGLYATLEGAIDLMRGERKHELTLTVLHYLGFKRLSEKLSTPPLSQLEQAATQYHRSSQ